MNRKWSQVWLSVLTLFIASLPGAPSLAMDCAIANVTTTTASDADEDDMFGSSVSVAGHLAIVGAEVSFFGSGPGAAYIFRWDGKEWIQDLKLPASSIADEDRFGASVSLSGDVAIVGAPGHDENGSESRSGSAHVYRFNGTAWVQKRLIASDYDGSDEFGTSVCASGDFVVVGAPHANSNTGAVYVFRYTGAHWVQDEKLTISDGAWGDHFGHSVAVSGNIVVVGADQKDGAGIESGAAYVFTRENGEWSAGTQLVPSDSSDYDTFGSAVSVQNDVIVVGVPSDDVDGDANAGSVYVFRREDGEWIEEAKLTARNPAVGDDFGSSVCICDDTLAVGAPGRSNDAGKVYVYRREGDTWALTLELVGTDREGGTTERERFGYSVSVSGQAIVAGSPFAEIGAYDEEVEMGTAAFFMRTGNGEDDKVFASDAVEGDNLGSAAAISGNVILAAADVDPNGPGAGSVYVLRHDGVQWVEEAKLTAFNGQPRDEFGISVSVDGEAAIIGARGVSSDRGAAYVFRHDTGEWLETKLVASPVAHIGDDFGTSVSISGDVSVVGAPDYEPAFLSEEGAVYVFRYDGREWNHEALLLASDGADDDSFGMSVAADGDVVVVGAFRHDSNGEDSGAAYVFRYDGEEWTEEAKLVASDAASEDEFGGAVAAWGDVVVVGAQKHDNGTDLEGGAVYVFRHDGIGWVEEAKLIPSDNSVFDQFGRSVSIEDDVVMVGAGTVENGYTGSAYVYRHDGITWIEEGKLIASDGRDDDRLGRVVALSGDIAIAAAAGHDSNGVGNSGAIYVFDLMRPCAAWLRGDADADGALGLADALYILRWVFTAGEEPSCVAAADATRDNKVSVADPVYILAYLYWSGPAPRAPFPLCNTAEGNELDCAAHSACE